MDFSLFEKAFFKVCISLQKHQNTYQTVFINKY